MLETSSFPVCPDPNEPAPGCYLLISSRIIGDIRIRIILNLPNAGLKEFRSLFRAIVAWSDLDSGLVLPAIVDNLLHISRDAVPLQNWPMILFPGLPGNRIPLVTVHVRGIGEHVICFRGRSVCSVSVKIGLIFVSGFGQESGMVFDARLFFEV